MFFVLEGSYETIQESIGVKDQGGLIESNSEKNKILYGSLVASEKETKSSVKFLTQGKIAWAITTDIIKSLGCSLEEAI